MLENYEVNDMDFPFDSEFDNTRVVGTDSDSESDGKFNDVTSIDLENTLKEQQTSLNGKQMKINDKRFFVCGNKYTCRGKKRNEEKRVLFNKYGISSRNSSKDKRSYLVQISDDVTDASHADSTEHKEEYNRHTELKERQIKDDLRRVIGSICNISINGCQYRKGRRKLKSNIRF